MINLDHIHAASNRLDIKPIEPHYPNSKQFADYCLIKLNEMILKRSNGLKKLTFTDERMRSIYIQLLIYLNNHQEKINEIPERELVTLNAWDCEKGLLLMGSYGTGKSLFLDFINENRETLKISKMHKQTARQLADLWASDTERFNSIIRSKASLIIDEIGDEPLKTMVYGNAENVVYRALKTKLDLIEVSSEKPKIYMATNLTKQELIERYDERVWDRINAYCNVVVFQGNEVKSLR